MEVEKRSSKGGFLQLFDWNVKSKKKLFSNKPDIPESSKHGKENLDNLVAPRFQQMKLHESMNSPSLIGTDWASSIGNDDGCGTKAPGVVARLMGLDSLPTLDNSDPGVTPFIDSQSFRHSLNPRMTTEFETDHSFYNMRNKLDGFTRNPVEDRLQKLQNRPIERFQTEVLPPKSAKSVPITHHRMLSPIKSPGFILSRNAAYIMETASKIIDQSPQSTLGQRSPSFRSSSGSVPLRIRDLKERMEASQKTPKSQNHVNSSKPQRKIRTEIVVLKQSVPGNLKNKSKLEGPTSRNSRNSSSMKQKEDLEKKQRNTPKKIQNKSTTSKNNEVLAQNNQKQNCLPQKDRSNLKPKVPYQNERKTIPTKKSGDSSATGGKKVTRETGKESLSKTKGISGKKRPTDGIPSTSTSKTNNVVIQEKERSVKCNISIDGGSNWESVDMKSGMDVVSFTFTSPIKRPENESCGQTGIKKRGLTFNFDDQNDVGTSKLATFGTPMIDSDALSVLLEQKLKELSSLIETSSNSDLVNDGSSVNSDKNDKLVHGNMQKDKGIITQDSDVSSLDQGGEVTECNSNSEESGTTTLTSNGNNHYTSSINTEQLANEIELLDSATSSLPNTTIFEFTSRAKWSTQWEPEYIKKILNQSDLTLNPPQKGINVNLYDHLETRSKNMDPYLKVQRKALFDCVCTCVENRREKALNGSYKEWAKWSLKKKDLMADEIWKEISVWMNMEDMEVDEVVEKDMSNGDGKWLDFEFEGFEEGVVVENDILVGLMDEIVVDFLCC